MIKKHKTYIDYEGKLVWGKTYGIHSFNNKPYPLKEIEKDENIVIEYLLQQLKENNVR